MSAGRSNIVDIAGELRHQTDDAYLVFDGKQKVWLPKSLVEHDEAEGTFAMPEWLATEKGLI